MAIVRMISRDLAEFREFQGRMVTVGKIRLGVYNGRYPEKIDTFRFTSEDGNRVHAIAQAYGGTAEQWIPQGSTKPQWEVITALKAVPVLIVNGQDVEPWYEAWGSGRTCIRRCDGIVNKVDGSACLCNGPDRPADARKLCKPTIRVQLMLAEAPGFGSWMLESHGENACQEIAPLGPFIATARIAIPAVLRLRAETRREWNPEKGKFETKNFYVPWLDTPQLTVKQIMAGGEELTQAIIASGGSAMIGGTVRQAIGAAPAAASVPAVEPEAVPAVVELDDEERQRILVAIEGAPGLPRLDGIRSGLKKRGIGDQTVIDAWMSKRNAIRAAEEMAATAQEAEQEAADPRDAALAGGRGFFADELAQYDEAVARGADHAAIVEAGGPAHWLATDDQARSYAEFEAAVGDTVTVGGIEFTKIGDNPFSPGVLGDMFEAPVEGVVEGEPDPLPQVPDGDYDADELYTLLLTGGGLQAPPLTTGEVGALVIRTFGVEHLGQATGLQLARLRAGLKAGAVSWR